MEADREKWNLRFRDTTHRRSIAPALIEFSPESGEGLRALDIACGHGQNALFLAEKGFHVDALDISDTALSQFSHPLITKIQIDLDHCTLKQKHYHVIINFNFLDRRLFPQMESALKLGGTLIFETFLNHSPIENRSNHKLISQELLYSFPGLKVLYYREKDHRATFLARRA
jgi:2-polyprenyl-3-methyl-5-hydroxy-6-metoxy-1,4-benzoquinol methylase